MKPVLPPLNALRAFEAAGRLGSFKEAAIELHVTPGAVSQQVRLLEGLARKGGAQPMTHRAVRAVGGDQIRRMQRLAMAVGKLQGRTEAG